MLIVSGGFFGRRWELYRVDIKGVEFYHSLRELPKEDGFFVISYGLSAETLSVKVKSSDVPPVIFVRIGGISRETKLVDKPVSLEPLGFSLDKQGYIQRVKQVKGEIEKGTVYQLNLSTKIDFSLKGDPLDLFQKFFKRQPTPEGVPKIFTP